MEEYWASSGKINPNAAQKGVPELRLCLPIVIRLEQTFTPIGRESKKPAQGELHGLFERRKANQARAALGLFASRIVATMLWGTGSKQNGSME